MMDLFGEKGEKKVEYLELIYDLIFVYIIGRNNSLLHAIEGAFISAETFLTYLLSTLVILQIWYFTTLFINRYGDNGVQEHICIFINMYLLYYMADGTRVHWAEYYVRYNVAWGLILLNLAGQYYVKYRRHAGTAPWELAHIRYNMRILLAEAGIVLLSIPVYLLTRFPAAPLGMVFGIGTILLTQKTNQLMSVDFPHLTERVMLYVVFTFGEMIIGIAGYFEGGVTPLNVYFSLMAFLIVAGLFVIYGYFYDHVIDREMKTTGTGYMMLHIVLIVALNNITAALEFMQEPEVSAVPKNIFLIVSLVLYFLFLFLLEGYARIRVRSNRRFYGFLVLLSLGFAVLMGLFYRTATVSIAISVLYIYTVFFALRHYGKKLTAQ